VLACSVRNCGRPLERSTRAFACARGHSFDIARRGYVNLLQPQDRRSGAAGDSQDAVDARARLLAAGVGQSLIDAIVRHANTLDLSDSAVVVDLGAGSGDALAAVARQRRVDGIGIDLSSAAVTAAARRFPAMTWVVANADRRLPIRDGSVDLVLSINARRNAAECARILSRPGYVLAAVPATDDLIELREVVQGEAVERERAATLVQEHAAAGFTPIAEETVRERRTLDRDLLVDLLRGTYRGARASAAARVGALSSLDVTLASEVRLFVRR
jgi:23S rRNA (guanine745-N1)-methyltransferase